MVNGRRRTKRALRLKHEARERREQIELFHWLRIASQTAGELTTADIQFVGISLGLCPQDAAGLAKEVMAERSALPSAK